MYVAQTVPEVGHRAKEDRFATIRSIQNAAVAEKFYKDLYEKV